MKRLIRGTFLWFLKWFFGSHIATFRVIGSAYCSPKRPLIVAAGPHIGQPDTAAVQYAICKEYGRRVADDLRPMAAEDYFFKNRLSRWFFEALVGAVPFERRKTKGKRKGVDRALEVLQGEKSILIFPEGGRREGLGTNLRKFQVGVGKIACDSGVEVVPCHIRGAGEMMPKGTNLISFLGNLIIGKYRNAEVVVQFGKPMVFKKEVGRREAAKVIQQAVEKIRP